MIKLGIIGTGGMAHAHARSFKAIRGVKLVAACDLIEERVLEFGRSHEIGSTYTDAGALLREADINAVSIVAPDAVHAPLALQAIAAGKHVLCEKPLALDYTDARKMARAAARKGVINMVNLSYRDAPAIQRAHALVQSGVLGTPMHVEASYLQSWLTSNVWGDWRTTTNWLWRLSSKHGSKGVLGDLGVHILDFASYPVGPIASVHCRLKTFRKDTGKRVGEYVLDANDTAVVTVEYKSGAIGTVHTTRWATGHANSLFLAVFGDKGALRIDLDRSRTELSICKGNNRHNMTWRTVACPVTPTIYQLFVRSIRRGVNEQPDFARGAEIQKALDACFVSDAEDRTVRL